MFSLVENVLFALNNLLFKFFNKLEWPFPIVTYLIAVEWETYSKRLDKGGVEFGSAARESGADADLHTVQQTDIPDGASGGVCLLRTLCTHHLLHQLTTHW